VTTVIQYFVDAVALGCLFALGALGVGVVFGVMRLANFAHGDFIMIGGYALFLFSGLSSVFTWLLAFATVALVAVATERVAFRWLRGADPSTLLMSSFAVSILLQNAVILAFGLRPKAVKMPGFVIKSVEVMGLRLPVISLLTILLTIVCLLLLVGFFKRTNLGLQMRAAAEDFRMARLLGTQANRVIAAAFAISGLLACIVSILMVSRSGTVSATMGLTPVLFAFVAVTIGGLGNLVGSALGGFLVGFVTMAMQAALPSGMSSYRDAFVFMAVVAVLIVRPQGLMPGATIEERI
jgi:branched-chain amino acid transport system permease protein